MNQTVGWEKFSSTNTYGDPSYAASVSKACFIEGRGYGADGVARVQRSDETVQDPQVECYFDANDADVATFSMNDRFTITNEMGEVTLRSQPDAITRFVGSAGEPWILVVAL